MEFPDPKKLENWVSYASKHRYRAVAAVVIFARFPFLYTCQEKVGSAVGDAIVRMAFIRESKGTEITKDVGGPAILFTVVDNKMIPDVRPLVAGATIAWETGAIVEVTPERIKLRLPDAVLGSARLTSIFIGVPNRVGAVNVCALHINNWCTYVKIVDGYPSSVIAILGYRKMPS